MNFLLQARPGGDEWLKLVIVLILLVVAVIYYLTRRGNLGTFKTILKYLVLIIALIVSIFLLQI